MHKNHQIPASVMLRNHQVIFNGKVIFETAENLELPAFLKACYQDLEIDYAKFYKMDLLSKLGFIASEYLAKDRQLNPETALILQNSTGSLETDLNYQAGISDENAFASPSVFVYTLPNIVLGELSIRHQLQTENAFFISEKFDASFLIVYLQNLFSTNKANAAICGWLDLDKEGYNVFLSLITQDEKGKALTAENLKENYEQFKTRA